MFTQGLFSFMSVTVLSPLIAISTIITTATTPISVLPEPESTTQALDLSSIYATDSENTQTFTASSDSVAADISRDSYTVTDPPAPEPAPFTSATAVTTTTPTTSIPVVPTALNGSTKEQIVQLALQYEGVPYVFGGATPSGWDCSGYVKWVTNQVTGIDFPHGVSSEAHSAYTHPVSRAEAQPGDFVVFYSGASEYHIGIYLGNNKLIHASKPGDVTKISPIWTDSVAFYSLNG